MIPWCIISYKDRFPTGGEKWFDLVTCSEGSGISQHSHTYSNVPLFNHLEFHHSFHFPFNYYFSELKAQNSKTLIAMVGECYCTAIEGQGHKTGEENEIIQMMMLLWHKRWLLKYSLDRYKYLLLQSRHSKPKCPGGNYWV